MISTEGMKILNSFLSILSFTSNTTYIIYITLTASQRRRGITVSRFRTARRYRSEAVGSQGGLQVGKCRAFGVPISSSTPVYSIARRHRSEDGRSNGCLQVGKSRAFGAPISSSIPLSILVLAREEHQFLIK